MTHPIIDDAGHEQFAVSVDRDTAKLEYQLEGHRLLLLHTEVPEAFRGQGVAGQLVEAAVAKARANHLTIVPWCPYARRWLREHPEQIGDITVDLKTPRPEGKRRRG
jgi:predicted GNAT family acetyltransferase